MTCTILARVRATEAKDFNYEGAASGYRTIIELLRTFKELKS